MKKKRYLFLIVLLVIVLVMSVAFSKYIYNILYERYLESQNFYFTSNLLNINSKTYNTSNWDGEVTYIIPLKLSNYNNNFAITEDDINYSISIDCPEYATCNSDLTGNIGVLEGSRKIDKDINISITMNEEPKNGEVIKVGVTAKSTAPYKKTLKAIFNIEISDYSFEIEDASNRAYLVLRLINGTKKEHTYHLSFDPKKINVDMTSNLVADAVKGYTEIDGETYINSLEITIDARNSEYLLFYKSDISQDYTYPIINKEPIITFE